MAASSATSRQQPSLSMTNQTPRKLFRQEAIDAQREKYLGETTLARPVPYWVFTLLAAGAAAVVLAVAIFGEYTRRERVEGFLSLDVGAARVMIPDAGRVAELAIKEGDEIAAGAAMAKIVYDRSASGGTGETIAQELQSRRLILEKEQAQWKELGEQQVMQLRRRIKDLENELGQADGEIKLQQTRVKSAKDQVARYQELAANRFYSDVQVKQKQDEVTEQELKLQALKRTRSQLDRDLSSARLEEPNIQLRARAQVDQVSRQMSELQENIANAEARRETVIKAPISGTITNVAVNKGQSAAADTTLATILPKGSGLHAELLVPTRAIGFINKGQEVVMRYEAFPYERFGQYKGVVSEISRAVWSPGDKVGPLPVKEAVYRVDVKLERQNVAALGQEVPLRPGMLVNADILLERRTLLEWLFEPVLQLKGRL
jgi:membrane fusion protein